MWVLGGAPVFPCLSLGTGAVVHTVRDRRGEEVRNKWDGSQKRAVLGAVLRREGDDHIVLIPNVEGVRVGVREAWWHVRGTIVTCLTAGLQDFIVWT